MTWPMYGENIWPEVSAAYDEAFKRFAMDQKERERRKFAIGYRMMNPDWNPFASAEETIRCLALALLTAEKWTQAHEGVRLQYWALDDAQACGAISAGLVAARAALEP